MESPTVDSVLEKKIARNSPLARTSRKVAGRSAPRSGSDTGWSSMVDRYVESGAVAEVRRRHQPFAGQDSAKRVRLPSDLNERTIAHQPADARALIRWLPPAVREKLQKAVVHHERRGEVVTTRCSRDCS